MKKKPKITIYSKVKAPNRTFTTKDQGEHGYTNDGPLGIGQLAMDKGKTTGKTKEISVNSFRHGYRK